MSKRYIFSQQCGDRKRAKLDVTVSDHNFPLSQNSGNGKDGDQPNTWGDDNDDEILLLASQACEDAFNEHNTSDLPNYSMCMQPATTSTQFYEPVPSTSKSTFQFKKPTSSPVNIVTTKMRDKCELMSSPLPGMSKVYSTNKINISDDIIVNNNINKQDANNIYSQLLKLQEENGKLKMENGKLLEKCVTKEGEASILRTQLKASQISVDNARLEKVKVQERIQMEWSGKWTAVTNQMHDLRTQLDFKNLEIISMKEKCKMLESNKVKLTQITLAGHDISMSQRNNGYGHDTSHIKKQKTLSSSVQTEDKSHFIHLNIPMREGPSMLPQVLPVILTPLDNQCSLLEYNEKLRQSADTTKCRIYSTFHRLPSTPKVSKEKRKLTNEHSIHETLLNMSASREWCAEEFLNVYKAIKESLQDVQCELETVRQKVTTAFQKEMDEKYIDVTSKLLVIHKKDLLNGCALYKEEQAMLARRVTAVLVYILEDSRCEHIVNSLLREHSSEQTDVVNIISKICTLLDKTACALLYSGLLLSITFLLKIIISLISNQKDIIDILKTIILSRPMPFVICEIIHLFGELSAESVKGMCSKGVAGNLKMDYDQGVLLYKRNSCVLQVMLKQIEGVLKCVQNECNVEHAVYNARNLILLYNSINSNNTDSQNEKYSCECRLVLMQVLVYALNVCAHMLDTAESKGDIPESATQTDILALCRSGIQVLYRCALRDVEFSSQLGHNEGHLLDFCEILRGFHHTDIYNSMLSEISSAFQSACEETPATYHQQAWLHSFHNFSLTD